MDEKKYPFPIREMYEQAHKAFIEGPTCVHSVLFDFTNEMPNAQKHSGLEEKEMAVFIANVALFNAYCCEWNAEVLEVGRDLPGTVVSCVLDFLLAQGIMKQLGKDHYDQWAGEDPAKTGLRILLRDSLVIFEDYAGRVLYVQDH